MGWIAFALGWALISPVSGKFWIDSLPYLLCNTSLYLLTILPDAAGDALTGKVTFCVKYGKKKTIYLAGFLYLFTFILAWNDYIFALVLISSEANKTVTLGLAAMTGGMAIWSWGVLAAGSVVATVPILILFVFIQRRLVAGFTAGALKG